VQGKNAGNADAFPSILTRQKQKFASENRVRIILRRLTEYNIDKILPGTKETALMSMCDAAEQYKK